MTVSVDDIAGELRAAAGDRVSAYEVLAKYFAESVDIRHVPAGTSDGPMPGHLLAAAAKMEVAAMVRALPDAESDSDVSVAGADITVRSRTRGVFSDGTAVDFGGMTVFTVADGRIVGLRAASDPAAGEVMRKLFEAGAFETPEEDDAAAR